MAEPILMPRLTIDMERGTVLEWRKEEGDTVVKGEVIALVFGDKVEWEVEAPASGVLLNILVPPDGEIEVAAPIGFVGEAGETPPAAGAIGSEAVREAFDDVVPEEDLLETRVLSVSDLQSPPTRKPKASPAAKRLAREKGVDLTAVKGSGPGGRIVEADVLALAGEAPGALPSPLGLSPLRKTIAERMLRSWRTVPHFTVETRVDMEAARNLKDRLRERGVRVTFNDLVVAAAAAALESTEAVQRRWDKETLMAFPGSNIGVAVHTEEGLVVPVVKSAAGLPLEKLSGAIRDKAERARTGRLLPDDVSPAALTVTNLGMFGITRFIPVVNHPECAILAAGAVEDALLPRAGGLFPRPVLALNLAIDHRAIDGGTAAQFLAKIRDLLEAGTLGGEDAA